MRSVFGGYFVGLLLAGFVALNVYMGLEHGKSISWATAVFVLLVMVNLWVQEVRR